MVGRPVIARAVEWVYDNQVKTFLGCFLLYLIF